PFVGSLHHQRPLNHPSNAARSTANAINTTPITMGNNTSAIIAPSVSHARGQGDLEPAAANRLDAAVGEQDQVEDLPLLLLFEGGVFDELDSSGFGLAKE